MEWGDRGVPTPSQDIKLGIGLKWREGNWEK